MAEFVSQVEFARMVGLAGRTIRKHIQNGKIFGDAINDKRKINPEIAKVQLASILSGRGGKRDEIGGDPKKDTRYMVDPPVSEANKGKVKQFQEKIQAESDSKLYLKSRATKEIIGAKMAGLDLKEREGTLIKREDVRHALFSLGRGARDKLMTVGTRLAPILAHKDSEHDIKLMIDHEIRESLEDLLGAFRDYE